MTIKDLKCFYEKKQEHYPISDSFVKDGYGQQRNGYIKRAKKDNLEINYKNAEPNQKWHLLHSYFPGLKDDLDVQTVYRIVCPELLLWMAEASEIDPEIIMQAEQKARATIDKQNGYTRNYAGREIKNIITWKMIENQIRKNNT